MHKIFFGRNNAKRGHKVDINRVDNYKAEKKEKKMKKNLINRAGKITTNLKSIFRFGRMLKVTAVEIVYS